MVAGDTGGGLGGLGGMDGSRGGGYKVEREGQETVEGNGAGNNKKGLGKGH